MGVEIPISSKGQIVIPKDVRDALGLHAGGRLTLERVGRQIILEAPQPDRQRISLDEAVARLRRLYRHEGPPVPIEQLGWSPDYDHDREA